jgi:putative membrane protein
MSPRMGLIIRWLINAVALYVTTLIVKGVTIPDFGAALVAALVLGIVNAVIRPVALILTLPLNILTLGLFTFVINAAMLWLVSKATALRVESAWAALLGAIVLSVVSAVLTRVVAD